MATFIILVNVRTDKLEVYKSPTFPKMENEKWKMANGKSYFGFNSKKESTCSQRVSIHQNADRVADNQRSLPANADDGSRAKAFR
jgi:hypothetical protein